VDSACESVRGVFIFFFPSFWVRLVLLIAPPHACTDRKPLFKNAYIGTTNHTIGLHGQLPVPYQMTFRKRDSNGLTIAQFTSDFHSYLTDGNENFVEPAVMYS
jgi:hypothetical protein